MGNGIWGNTEFSRTQCLRVEGVCISPLLGMATPWSRSEEQGVWSKNKGGPDKGEICKVHLTAWPHDTPLRSHFKCASGLFVQKRKEWQFIHQLSSQFEDPLHWVSCTLYFLLCICVHQVALYDFLCFNREAPEQKARALRSRHEAGCYQVAAAWSWWWPMHSWSPLQLLDLERWAHLYLANSYICFKNQTGYSSSRKPSLMGHSPSFHWIDSLNNTYTDKLFQPEKF